MHGQQNIKICVWNCLPTRPCCLFIDLFTHSFI